MKTLKLTAACSLLLAGVLAGCSASNYDMNESPDHSAVSQYESSQSYMGNSAIGPVLTTPQGATVYTYDNDQPGKASCYGDCAMKWPPVMADASAQPHGRMSIVDRTDGSRQWAYDSRPLYTYIDDASDGDVAGDGKGDLWHVVR